MSDNKKRRFGLADLRFAVDWQAVLICVSLIVFNFVSGICVRLDNPINDFLVCVSLSLLAKYQDSPSNVNFPTRGHFSEPFIVFTFFQAVGISLVVIYF